MNRLASALLLPMILIISACTPKELELEVAEMKTVAGSLTPLRTSGSFSASAITCSNPVAKIYKLNDDGAKIFPAVGSGSIASDGSYSLSVDDDDFKIREASQIQYIVSVEGCSTEFTRPVTGNRNQDLSFGTSLIGFTADTSLGSALFGAHPSSLDSFLPNLDSASSLSAAYSTITGSSSKRAAFTSLFGVAPEALMDLPPKLMSDALPSGANEGQATAMSLGLAHWSPSYDIAVKWKMGASTIGEGDNLNWTPEDNSQGTKTLTVYWGRDDGSGHLDETKPFDSKTFQVAVADTRPATPPAITAPAFAGSPSITVDIDTGAGRANCSTFSSLAITEDTVLPPAIADFTITCTQAGTQSLAYTLGPGVVKTLRLWARDSSGNISVAPTSTTITMDQTPPAVHLTSLVAGGTFRGGDSATITWTATDTNLPSSPISLYASTDSGATWAPIATGLSNSGSAAWTYPAVSNSHMRIKAVAVDSAGNSAEDASPMDFAVDATPPSAPSVTLASAALANSRTLTLGVTCTADDDGIFIGESATPPAFDGAGWQACTAAPTFDVSTGDGLKTVYVWSKDSVGNVSASAGTVTFTLDQTNPSISLTSHNGGFYRGGQSTTLTWTATDTHWGSGTLHIEESDDAGVTWSDIAAAAPNTGSSTFTLASLNNSHVRFRLSGCDQVGNCATASSSGDVTVDSQAPALSAMTINDGAAYAGTVNVSVKLTLSDNLASGSQIKVRTANANAGTGDCQGQYANTNWITYTNAATGIPHVITASDGTKKVCAWAKDAAGNVSVISPSSGTDGVDSATIQYQVGNPPSITGFTVTRNLGGTVASAGDAMAIQWTASDFEGLDNNPVSFSYTTDNVVWKDIVTNLPITTASNVTWLGGLSGQPTSGSGTITTWTAPVGTYFRVRATARDFAGNSAAPILSDIFNAGSWSIFAGSRDRGIGGGGLGASLYGNPASQYVAIDPTNGDIYAVDAGYGVRKLDAKTGTVSTFIDYGTWNLPTDGPIPANMAGPMSSGVSLRFDSKGRLYITAGSSANASIYQIDFAASHVRLYAGGGTNNDGGVASTTLMATNLYAFDESDNMYLFTMCATYGYPYDQGKRLVKIAQNPDGTPGTVTRIIGDCTYAAPNYGTSAVNSPAGDVPYIWYSSLVAVNNGDQIYFEGYGNKTWKIVNGTVYSMSLGSNSCGSYTLAYNPVDGKLYHSNVTCGIDQVTPSGAQNGGETKTTLFAGNATASGCTNEGIPISNACTKTAMLNVFNGTVYFSDGIIVNSPSSYRVRYVDASSKIRSVLGTLPFVGEGLDKAVTRASFAGIYYKTLSESNQAAFPEGLYFQDSSAALFGRVNAGTGSVSVLWGNQARKGGGFSNGATISKDLSMGAPYSPGSAQSLTFDSTGLPWMRADNTLVQINASNQIVYKTTGGAGTLYWHDLADGANPASTSMYVYGGQSNLTLKDQALFLLGGGYVYFGLDPNISIRTLDFAAHTTTRILGGTALYSSSTGASADVASGVSAAPLYYNCYPNNCFMQYTPSQDRLYFSELTKLRYITTPSNTATSTLVTLFSTTDSAQIFNFIFRPDGSQIWYVVNGTTLRCHDISSGKSWCDDTTNHFQKALDSGLSFNPRGANMLTWTDNNTMMLSTYGPEVLQFRLPTGP